MIRRLALWLSLALLALVPTGLWARSLTIARFDAEIAVQKSGDLYVTETIVPRFEGAWNGIYRTIPVVYQTPQGFRYDLLLDLISVTDGADHPLRHESSREGNYRKVKIWVPGAQDATRTVVLRYRVPNGLKFWDTYDELYWNVTGDEWEVPIESASAVVTLPDAVRGVKVLAWTGPYGSRASDATTEVQGPVVRVKTKHGLGFKEGLTIAVAWDPGVVQRPSVVDRSWLFLRANSPLFIPVGVLVVMLLIWRRLGRDPRLRPIVTQYEPPAGMTPAEVGALTDESADMRDITATIVDLAVRGYLEIEEYEEPQLLGLWQSKSYAFRLRKGKESWEGLAPHEQSVLGALFKQGSADYVTLSDLRNRFYTHLPTIKDNIFRGLLTKKCYRSRPDHLRRAYLVGGMVVGGAIAWLGSMAVSAGGASPVPMVAAGILTGLVIIAVGWFMPARTTAGGRALEGVLGFEEFLSRVEGDRLQRVEMTPALFEKFLPYAMALGVEDRWAAAFADIYRQPPEWYHGRSFTDFQPRAFTSSLNHMAAAAGSAMSSAPRSSGGSGFGGGGGGGGSSGGGFGGGGGGGF